MKNIMRYQGYTGQFEYDDEVEIFHGEVLGIDDVVTFQGKSVSELKKALRESVEEYLRICLKIDKSPDKPYSGKFTIRISPDLHRQVHTFSKISGKSNGDLVAEALKNVVSQT